MAQTAAAEPQQNKMGVMPVGKLLLSMGLPMVLSMLVQALYNIVDSIFVAQINEAALTAVSMAFPVQNFMIAAVSGMGVGVNSLLSRSLGEGNIDQANRAANNGIFLSFMTMIVFVIFGIFGSRPFFAIQTSDPEIISAGATYISICCIGSFGCFGQIIFERLLQATGQAHLSMITQMAGAITNIILDPIMIFGLVGFPKMGVAGAALATVIGQVLACCLGLFMNIRLNKTLTISPKYRPEKRIIAEIYRVGIPSIAMQSVGSIMNMAMNMILMGFTSTATAVFGVYYKLQSFAIMPVIGLSNAMIPIVAFNYGARKRSRIDQTVKYSMISAEIFLVIVTMAFLFLPQLMLKLFSASDNMLAMGIPALRTMGLNFLICGICICAGSVFQALGNGVYSLVVSVMRQLVVLIPVAWLMSLTGNLELVWISFPIAELMSLAVSLFFLKKIFSSRLANMK